LLHHPLAEPALACHVGEHDAIARLGQQLDLFQPACRLHPEGENRHVEVSRDFEQLLDMAREFAMGAMDVGALFAGQLDLAARFQCDRGSRPPKRDYPSFLILGLVAVAVGQAA
jgi:hypothetical protein